MRADEQVIQGILQQIETAWNNYDSLSLAAVFTEDANFIQIFGHGMVTKLGPLCRVKLLKNGRDKLVVRSPEKAALRTEIIRTRLLFPQLLSQDRHDAARSSSAPAKTIVATRVA